MRISYASPEESPTSIDRSRRQIPKKAARFAQVDNVSTVRSRASDVSDGGRSEQARNRGRGSRQPREPGDSACDTGGKVSRKRSKSRAPSLRIREDLDFCSKDSLGARSTKSAGSSRARGMEKKSGGSGRRVQKKKLDAKMFALSMELIEHVSKGQPELAEEKIKQGVSPNYADYDKRTPLHLAAVEGHLEVVEMLLRNGANVNVEDRWGSKPYDEAVKNNYTEIAGILREHGEEGGEHTLAKEHHDGLELLEYCARGFEKSVREKIASGTKAQFADYDLRTPLHLAACEGHTKIVELLLKNGADATFKDRFGHTAVDNAMMNGMLEVLEVMDKAGVKIAAHIFDRSCTPEFERNMMFIDICAKGNVAKAMKLLREGADAAFEDYDLRTPLHLACAEGRVNVVKLLMQAGACAAVEDRWKATPFDEAVKNGHEEVVRLLEGNTSPADSIGWELKAGFKVGSNGGASVVNSKSS